MAETAIQTRLEDQAGVTSVIQVENVSKLFRTPSEGTIGALQEVSVDIRPSEFVTVVGPSGCGKSTLLKLIAGFSAPSSGRILFQGDEVRGLNTKVGYVPQERATFHRKVSSFPGSPWKKTSASAWTPNAIRGKIASGR